MSTRTWVTILTIGGSIIGGYIPTLFGASFLSFWGLLTSAMGAFIGLGIGMKLGD